MEKIIEFPRPEGEPGEPTQEQAREALIRRYQEKFGPSEHLKAALEHYAVKHAREELIALEELLGMITETASKLDVDSPQHNRTYLMTESVRPLAAELKEILDVYDGKSLRPQRDEQPAAEKLERRTTV